MTVAQIEKRLKEVEQVVEKLALRLDSQPSPNWYATHAGRFKNDPIFDEIVKLGAENIGHRNGLRGGASVLILDSDILTIIQRAEGAEYNRLLARLNASREEVVVTIVTFEEQMRGWMAYIAKQKLFSEQASGYLRLHALLEDFLTRKVLDFDESAVAKAEMLRKSRLRVGTMDLKIAAIALATNSTVITRNTSDFGRVPGLLVEDWTR